MTSEKSVTRRARKIGITIGGGVLLIIGIIAIPYPGPGWLIVFAALAILAQEYSWAQRLLRYGRGRYDAFQDWANQQGMVVKVALFIMTSIVVVATLWLINAYGTVNHWLGLGQDWLNSPFVR